MEHKQTLDEKIIMSSVDFIVPLKQVGIITRSVLEAIQVSYEPRRIVVVTSKVEGDILRKLVPYWKVGPVECVDEALFFVRNFGLSFDDIIAEYDTTRPGDNIRTCLIKQKNISDVSDYFWSSTLTLSELSHVVTYKPAY